MQLFLPGWGYPIAPPINQHWNALTGRFVVNWTPKLDFTDQTSLVRPFRVAIKLAGLTAGANAAAFLCGGLGEVASTDICAGI